MTDKSYFKMLGVFEYYAGCNLNINSITSHTVDCGVGRGCYSPVECEGCSIGECIQKGKATEYLLNLSSAMLLKALIL